jgi:predicted nuclease of predicted toxin-antitoxin system
VPRLLFDENLSPHLPQRLASAFPASQHVRDLQLRGASDLDIWSRAAAAGFVLVSKDDDFRQLSFLRGAPLEQQRSLIDTFIADPEEALLLLRLPQPG